MAKVMSKSELIQKIAEMHSNKNMARKDVKAVIESLAEIGYKELNKSGAFLVPGFAKFVVIKKPATKERSGINPFTKEPTIFKAKPARKIVKARPVKAAKDAERKVGDETRGRNEGAAVCAALSLALTGDYGRQGIIKRQAYFVACRVSKADISKKCGRAGQYPEAEFR